MVRNVKSDIIWVMKVLWLSSVQLSDKRVLGSGTWIPGLFSIMKKFYPKVEIINITKGRVSHPTLVKTFDLTEWLIPQSSRMTPNTIRDISDIIRQVRPDVIQVWGTEDIWGVFPFNEIFPEIPAILEIQGILASVSEEYYGGLTPMQLLKCWNIKECLKPSSSLPFIRKSYTKNVAREELILRKFQNIGVQSKWSADVVRTYNDSARLYHSDIALREAFYESDKWAGSSKGEIRIFSTALMGQPLKGGYTLFRAFDIVKRHFPAAKLILAGAKEEGIRRSGLCRMLTKFAKRQGFLDSIEQLGLLKAEQLAEQYRKASVFVNPSNWESYSVVTAEAMYLGCPTIAAYSGAMPELGANGSVLYFPKGDFRICASLVMNVLRDSNLAQHLSEKSILAGERRQDRARIADNQMFTYKQLISE